MMDIDGRRLDHKTLEEIRIRAVLRVEAGESPEVVIKALGFSRSCIYVWIAKYREGGLEALRAKPILGRKSKLNGKQLQKLFRIITTKDPLQFKFTFALWTRDIVRQLIKSEFNVRLSDVSVGRLLRKIGLTPQRPLFRAYQQDKEKVKKWKNEEYPEIKKQANKCGATIYFLDEASVRSDYHSGTTWGRKGKTPIVKTTGARYSMNMISAITESGKMRFMTVNGTLNSEKFISFLKRLIHNSSKPIFLILDNHSVHKSKKVKDFLKSQNGEIRLYFLPGYSPELNPDEWVWNHLKNHSIGRSKISGAENLRKKVIKFLKRLQRLPKLISNFFKAPDLDYIHYDNC